MAHRAGWRAALQVRDTEKGTEVQRQYRLSQAHGEEPVRIKLAARRSGAHGAPGGHGKPAAQLPTATTGEISKGEVRRVDTQGGTLTFKHADMKNLGMQGMNMVFVVRDRAINGAGTFMLTEMQMAQ